MDQCKQACARERRTRFYYSFKVALLFLQHNITLTRPLMLLDQLFPGVSSFYSFYFWEFVLFLLTEAVGR